MLIPISHERGTLLRWPIVTLAIIAICLVAHLATWPPPDETGPAREALLYYLERPYLDPGEELLDDLPAALFQNFQLSSEPAPGTRPPAAQVRREQRELDAKLAAWMAVREAQPLREWGLVPADHDPVHLVTHAFLHVGWVHLLSNLFILYLAAPPVEDLWGRPLFAVFYLVAGAAAGLAFVAQYPFSEVPLAGASGAIAAVMGVFLVRFWKVKIRFFYFFWLIKFYTGTFWASAWIMLPLWFGNELFQAYVAGEMSHALPEEASGGGVAYMAHVGGFVFGVAVALAIRVLGLEERMKGKIHEKIGLEERPVLEEAARARRIGAPDEAMRLLAGELRTRPSDREALGALWDVAVEAGRAPEVAPRVQHLIELELRAGDTDLALQHWQELDAHAPEARVAPRVAAPVAERFVAEGEPALARRAVERALEGNATLPPVTGLRIARTAAAFDAALAAEAARRTLAQPEVEPELRAELEALVRAEPPPPAAPTSVPPPAAAARQTPPPSEPRDGSPGGGAPAAGERDAPPPRRPLGAPPPELSLRPIPATLRALADDALAMTTADGRAVRLRFEKVTGVGVGEIRPGQELPYFLLDLLLDPPEVDAAAAAGARALRVVRLDTRGFDPLAVVDGDETPARALATIVGRLLAATGADLYPKEFDPFNPQPFSSFPSEESYERELVRQLAGDEE